MQKHISNIADSLRQLGDIRVTDWDFRAFLRKDIRDLEIGPSLRKLGNTKVMEWDFRTVVPAVQRFANQEVDVMDWVKRAANYKVMEWDFRSALSPGSSETEAATGVSGLPVEMQDLAARLGSFLRFLVAGLADEADRARLRVREVAPGVLGFRLVVTQADQKLLVGHHGATASSIRNLLKGTAEPEGVHALLEILTHDEEMLLGLKEQRAGERRG